MPRAMAPESTYIQLDRYRGFELFFELRPLLLHPVAIHQSDVLSNLKNFQLEGDAIAELPLPSLQFQKWHYRTCERVLKGTSYAAPGSLALVDAVDVFVVRSPHNTHANVAVE